MVNKNKTILIILLIGLALIAINQNDKKEVVVGLSSSATYGDSFCIASTHTPNSATSSGRFVLEVYSAPVGSHTVENNVFTSRGPLFPFVAGATELHNHNCFTIPGTASGTWSISSYILDSVNNVIMSDVDEVNFNILDTKAGEGESCGYLESDKPVCETGLTCQNFQCVSLNSDDPCDLPWGGQIDDGDSRYAFRESISLSCVKETRVCDDGDLSGSYQFATCTPTTNNPCDLPWGGTIAHGGTVTAYQLSSGSSCPSQTRVCNNRVLSGAYQYQSCTIENPDTGIYVVSQAFTGDITIGQPKTFIVNFKANEAYSNVVLEAQVTTTAPTQKTADITINTNECETGSPDDQYYVNKKGINFIEGETKSVQFSIVPPTTGTYYIYVDVMTACGTEGGTPILDIIDIGSFEVNTADDNNETTPPDACNNECASFIQSCDAETGKCKTSMFIIIAGIALVAIIGMSSLGGVKKK